MTETRAVSIEDVRMLVAERQRYDDWLSALEARRAETPARVFERVHGDYSGRRSAVLEQLRGHITTLASLGDDLDAKLGEVDSGLSTLEDERAEAMLRTAVGEFDGQRWETVRQEVEARIAGVSEERAALVAEVGDVRALLASARSERPAASEPASPASTEEAPSANLSVAPATESSSAGMSSEQHTEPSGHDLQSLDDGEGELLEIAGHMPEAMTVQNGHDAGVDAFVAARGDEGDLDDALALFAPSGSSTAPAESVRIDLDGIEAIDDRAERVVEARTVTMTPPSPSSVPYAAPSSVSSSAPASSSASNTAPAPAPASTHGLADADPFDDLAFLRSVTDQSAGGPAARGASASTEPQKTLRCTECGTMNFPTEWYCERCGGELAAF